MAKTDIAVWGIHDGSKGEAYNLFTKKNTIALGWPNMGDLSQLKGDRETFKSKLIQAYPETKLGAIPVNAGELFRFVHEIKLGDVVVFPTKIDNQVYLGKIESPYKYDLSLDSHYPNTRSVKWVKIVPRIDFTQGALYEIGAAMALFQVKNYTDEFLSALEGNVALVLPQEDDSIAIVKEEIEQTTRDFILKQLSQEMKGHPLEHFVGHLLEKMGYRTRISPVGTDSGVDIIAHKDELGFEPPIIKVQVKSGDGKISEPVISALYGKVGSGEFGLFVTLASFTPQALSFARNKTNLRLIDGRELVDLLLEHYEQFDSNYKGLIPLKHVYIPESFKEFEY